MAKPVSSICDNLKFFGLPSTATIDEVRSRYHELVRDWHPDRRRDDSKRQAQAEFMIREINRAFNEIENAFERTELEYEYVTAESGDFDGSKRAGKNRFGRARGYSSILQPIGTAALAPVELLFGIIKAFFLFPFAFAAEISGLFYALLCLTLAAALGAIAIYGIHSIREHSINTGNQSNFASEEPGSLKASLQDWAERKKELSRPGIKTFANGESAIEDAPPIINSTIACDVEAVSRMIALNPASINSSDSNGDTPLAWAAKLGCSDLVEILVSNGAKVDSRAENGLRPVDWAKRYGHKAITESLEKLQ